MTTKSSVPVSRTGSHLFPGSAFLSLQQEIDRLFDDFGRGFPSLAPLSRSGPVPASDLTPRMDVAETDQAIELTAELPGMQEKDVEVSLNDNVLTIRGEKKAEKDEKKKDYHLVERHYGSFARRMELPAGIDPAKIEAKFSNGVLSVIIPKAAPSIAKKIEVKNGA